MSNNIKARIFMIELLIILGLLVFTIMLPIYYYLGIKGVVLRLLIIILIILFIFIVQFFASN